MLAPSTQLERREEEYERSVLDLDPPERIADLEYSDSFTTEMFPRPVFGDEARILLASMNTKQQEIFYVIHRWCVNYIAGKNPESFYIFCTGGGGVGKSRLIFSVAYQCHKMLAVCCDNPISSTVLVTAPTGIAARNINGMTLHTAFKIPIKLGEKYLPLREDKLNTLRSQLGHLKILIIDECSMVSQSLMRYIDNRLRQIMHKPGVAYGGVSVLCVGDFFQLPPVRASSLLKAEFWRDKFAVSCLTEIMRQKDDKEFASLLNYLRCRRKDDVFPSNYLDMLTSRMNLPFDVKILHIFARNKQVDEHNNKILRQNCQQLFSIEAQHNVSETRDVPAHIRNKFKTSDFSLPETLCLGVGCRVMMIKNVNLLDGLCNGSLGTVDDISVSQQGTVQTVWVDFDDEKTGLQARVQCQHMRNRKLTPVKRHEEPGTNVTRLQFPLRLSYACTVHKTQGITVDKCAVSFRYMRSPGQAYVALSRVKRLDGLFLLDFNPSAIYCDDSVDEFLQCMRLLQSENSCHFDKQYSHSLMLFNVENFKRHRLDLYNDIRMWNSDIVCLTETHLSQNSTVTIKQRYNFFHTPRYGCYTNNRLNDRSGGGVGIFVNESLTATRCTFHVRNIEYLSLYINEWELTVTVIYKPPQYGQNAIYLNGLAECLHEISKISHKSIVVGDFNVDLNSTSTCKLLECFHSYGYIQIVRDSATRFETLIDHVYTRNICSAKANIILTYFSHHDAIKVCFDL